MIFKKRVKMLKVYGINVFVNQYDVLSLGKYVLNTWLNVDNYGRPVTILSFLYKDKRFHSYNSRGSSYKFMIPNITSITAAIFIIIPLKNGAHCQKIYGNAIKNKYILAGTTKTFVYRCWTKRFAKL